MTLEVQIIAYIIAINIMTFVAYGLDKKAARKGWRRISERTLLRLTLLGGTIGAMVAQSYFRHKTRKQSFRWQFYLTIIVQLVLVVALLIAANTPPQS